MFKTLTRKISKVGTFSSEFSTTSSTTSSSSSSSSGSTAVLSNHHHHNHRQHHQPVSHHQSKKPKFRVVAIHNYSPVNQDTDLALVKGHHYDILDSSGVWWLAWDRRQNQIGLVPHNYLRMVSPPTGNNQENHSPSMNYEGYEDLEEEPEEETTAMEEEDDDDDDGEFFPRTDFLQEQTGSSFQPHQMGFLPELSGTSGEHLMLMSTLLRYHWFFSIDRDGAEQLLKQPCNVDGSFLVRPSTTENNCFTLSILIRKNVRFTEVKHYLIQRCKQTGRFYIRPQEKFSTLDQLVIHYRQTQGHLMARLTQVPCRANFIWQQSLLRNNNRREPQPPVALPLTMNNRISNSIPIGGKSRGSGNVIDLEKSSPVQPTSWEIKVSELQLLEELGSGQFGVVRHGKWRGKFHVAVKLMKEGTMSEQDFIKEAKVMTKLQHPNLVKLYGVCIEHRPICIVAEFMKHGSLLSFLRKNEQRILDSPYKIRFLLNMCIQVASGMAYLESRNYIHRDLAARNCLVGQSNVVKVADFGLTRYVIDDEYQSSGGTKFPIRWAPPEVLWFTRFSSKSDVWAYGILVWEVFSLGKLPYGKLTNAEVVEKIREGHRLDKPKQWCPAEIFSLMKNCWQEAADKRPAFHQLERRLLLLKDLDLATPSNDERSSGAVSGQNRPF